jgi:hypothetical protein
MLPEAGIQIKKQNAKGKNLEVRIEKLEVRS